MAKPKGYYANGYYHGYVPSVGKYWQFESESAYCEFCVKGVKFSD